MICSANRLRRSPTRWARSTRGAAHIWRCQSIARVGTPSEIEVEFNLKLTSEAGVVLAKAGLESMLNVKLKWARDEAQHAAKP